MDASKWRTGFASNRFQALILIGGMLLLLTAIGWIVGGRWGVATTLLFSLSLIVFNTQVSPRFILRMYQAQPLSRNQAPALYDIFEVLNERAKLKKPARLFYVPSRLLNAFAVGDESNGAVAVTDGILRVLNRREIAGVLAHELAHLRHHDTWVMMIADTFSRVINTLALIGQFLIFFAIPAYLLGADSFHLILKGAVLSTGPILSYLLQMALSRSREFKADLGAVQLTNDPLGLAAALGKLERCQTLFQLRWLIPKRKSAEPSLLRTHPVTQKRIAALSELGEEPGVSFEPLCEITQAPALRHTGYRERFAPNSRPRIRSGPRFRVSGLWY